MDYDERPVTSTKTIEYIKLIIVLLVLGGTATLMSTNVSFDVGNWVRWFLASFFVVFGSFKLIGYDLFTRTFPGYNPIAKKIKVFNYAYPLLEILLGMLFVVNFAPLFTIAVTIVLMIVGINGVLKGISTYGQSEHCATLNHLLKLPLTKTLLIQDFLVTALSLVLLVFTFV
jgi:hypothetical protein